MKTAREAAEPTARRYGGQSRQDRMADRRERLVTAAIAVAARAGREGVTVTNVCAEAGLTTRYFYESFSGREALFAEAFRVVGASLVAILRPDAGKVPLPGEAIRTFFDALSHDPGEARAFLLDLNDLDPSLRSTTMDLGKTLGELFAPDAPDLIRIGVLGAIMAIARQWIQEEFGQPRAAVIAAAEAFTNI